MMNAFSSHLTVIGISPRNPYYADPQNIEFALDAVLAEQNRVYVLITDVPDIKNYLAFGYGAEQASKKAFRQGAILKKSIREICERKGYSCGNIYDPSSQVRLIDWGRDIEPDPVYQTQLAEVQDLYQRDSHFRADIRKASEGVLHSRLKQLGSNEDAKKKLLARWTQAIDIAVGYPEAELGNLITAPRLLDAEHVDYLYHRPWPIYENLLNGKYACERPKGLGFRIVGRQEADVR